MDPVLAYDVEKTLTVQPYPTAICTRRRCGWKLERDQVAVPAAKYHVQETGHTVEVVRTSVTTYVGTRKGADAWRRL